LCSAALFPVHGRRKGRAGGPRPPWILKLFKKRLFYQFRGVKTKFHYFWPPLEKILANPLLAPHGKNLPTPMLQHRPMIVRKWFVTTVLNLPTHILQPQNFVRVFCNDSEAILSHISALCPRGQRFLWEKHIERIRKSYSFSENGLKHEMTLAKNVPQKVSKVPITLEQFFKCIAIA